MMKKMQIVALALPLAIFGLLVVLLIQALKQDPGLLPSAHIGKTLPDFELTRLLDEHQPVDAEDLAGGPALINVWATWCPSCMIEHPALNALAREGVVIYGLNYKDDRAAAREYLDRHGNPYKMVIYDPEGTLGFDLGVYGAPETFVIDAEGIVHYRHTGVISEDVWLQTIKPILDKLAQPEAS